MENKFDYFKILVYINDNKFISGEIKINEEIVWFKDEIYFY